MLYYISLSEFSAISAKVIEVIILLSNAVLFFVRSQSIKLQIMHIILTNKNLVVNDSIT